MIYFLNELVNWGNPKTAVELEFAKGISELRSKYFGEDKPNVIKLEDPKGRRVTNKSGYYEPFKIFPLELIGGAQAEYRYTSRLPSLDKNGKPEFGGERKHVRHILELKKDDVELAYFLLKYNRQVLSGRIKMIDDEAVAEGIATKASDDLDLKFYIYSKNSPIAETPDVLKSVAIAFGINDVKSLGVNQIKNRIYEAVTAGNKSGDRFVNTQIFMGLVSDEDKREITHVLYDAITHKDLVYSTKDFSWHFSAGGEIGEAIFTVAGKDAGNAIQILINACINKKELRKTVFAFLGKQNFQLDLIRKKNILTLREEGKAKELKFNNNTSKEDLVKLIAEFDGVEYEPPAPL